MLLCVAVFAQKDITHLLADLKNAPHDSARINAYNELFNHYMYSNPDSAVWYLEGGLKYFTEKKSKLGIAKMISLLAAEDEIQGRRNLARKRYLEALALFKEVNYKDGIAWVSNGLGVIEGRSGHYDLAYRHFMEALRIFEGTKSKKGISNTYLKLGVVSEVSNSLDRALEYYGKAMETLKDDSASRNSVYLYNNIAIVYGKKGDFKKALEYLEIALRRSQAPDFIGVRVQSLMNMGIVYDHFGEDEKALKYFREAIDIAKAKNLPEEYARATVNMSSVIAKKDPQKAVESLKEALVTTKSLNQRTLELEIYDYMVDDYKRLGNYKEALVVLEQQKRLQDSLFNIDKAKEIANIEAEFELDKTTAKMQELEVLGNKNLLQRNIIVMVAIVMAVTLIVLTVFLRKITRLNEQLFRRETELQRSNTVKDKLFSIIGHDLRGPIGNIPIMLQILRDETTSAEEREYIYETLLEHSQASLETLDKLLYWGQAQIKGLGLKPVDFNPDKSLNNNLQLIRSNAEQKHIAVKNNVPPDISIHGDPAHFDFIIRNLLSNALKFTHAHGSVSIQADPNSTEGFTVFSIKDSGVGITRDKTAEIFEPFSSSTRGTADERGTSIGLMLCKEFVQQNGGRIWVESEVGKGSTFFFSFQKS